MTSHYYSTSTADIDFDLDLTPPSLPPYDGGVETKSTDIHSRVRLWAFGPGRGRDGLPQPPLTQGTQGGLPVAGSNDPWNARRGHTSHATATATAVSAALRPHFAGAAPGMWASDHYEQSLHCTGWQFIAIRAIMRQWAAAEVTVYERDRRKRRQQRREQRRGIRSLDGDAAATRRKATATSLADPGQIEDDRRQLPDSHGLCRLLARPNPWESGSQFRARAAQQLNLTGTAYVWCARRNGMGVPLELYIIPTAVARPQPASGEFPYGSYYVRPLATYSAGAAGSMPEDGDPFYAPGAVSQLLVVGGQIDWRDVRAVRWPHPVFLSDGLSPLEAGALMIDVAEEIERATRYSMIHATKPGLVVTVDPQVNPSSEDKEAFRRDLQNRNAGTGNAGRELILPPGVDAKQIESAPRDMDYTGGRPQARDGVLGLFNTPATACGISEAGAYSAFFASMLQFTELAVQPDLSLFAEEMTNWLGPCFGGHFDIRVQARGINDPELVHRDIATLKEGKAMTKDELRMRLGLKPWGGERGDALAGDDDPGKDGGEGEGGGEGGAAGGNPLANLAGGGDDKPDDAGGEDDAESSEPADTGSPTARDTGVRNPAQEGRPKPPVTPGGPGKSTNGYHGRNGHASRFTLKDFTSSDHPRGKDGRFISAGDIADAAHSPEKAKELLSRVKPADAGKLHAAIAVAGGHAEPAPRRGTSSDSPLAGMRPEIRERFERLLRKNPPETHADYIERAKRENAAAEAADAVAKGKSTADHLADAVAVVGVSRNHNASWSVIGAVVRNAKEQLESAGRADEARRLATAADSVAHMIETGRATATSVSRWKQSTLSQQLADIAAVAELMGDDESVRGGMDAYRQHFDGVATRPDNPSAVSEPRQPRQPRPARPSVDTVVALAREAADTPQPHHAAELAHHLAGMTVAQIHAVKRTLGIRAGGRKPDLVAKIVGEATRRLTVRQRHEREARAMGHSASSLHHLARMHRSVHNEHADTINRLRKDAAELYAHYSEGGKLTRSMRAFRTGDHTEIAHFDVIARTLADRYPDILGDHGYHADGYDADAPEAAQRLYDLIAAGPQPRMGHDESYRHGLAALADYEPAAMRRPRVTREELAEVPF